MVATTNPILEKDTLRIIDANLNRLNEGVRVVEDIFRYALNHKTIASSLKHIRHQARIDSLYDALLDSRDVANDVLRPTKKTELARAHTKDIIIANFKRAQEAARVLEELLKLSSHTNAENFKQIRYDLYSLEKEAMQAYLK